MITIYAGLKNGRKFISYDEFENSIGHEFEDDHSNCKNLSWWVLDGDIVRQPNADELQAREDAETKSQENQLRVRTLQWQANQGKLDSNYSDLIAMGRIKALMEGVEMGEKLQACYDWLDSLWAVYDSAKTSQDWFVDYDVEVGPLSMKYDEVRAEIEA